MSDEWAVTITFGTEDLLTEDQLVTMADTAQEWDATIATRGQDGNGLTFRVDLVDPSPAHAVQVGLDLAWKIVHESQIAAELVALAAETPELAELHALRPDVPELMAATDVAELLHISRQRVHQLHAEHPQFPAPFLRLGSGPVWTRPVIEHFAKVWARKPGRPARERVS